MTSLRVPVLRCDGHTRVGPCPAEFVGMVGLTFTELRDHAADVRWSSAITPGRRDYCPEHTAR